MKQIAQACSQNELRAAIDWLWLANATPRTNVSSAAKTSESRAELAAIQTDLRARRGAEISDT